jgi:excisionase family DNA binding protein
MSTETLPDNTKLIFLFTVKETCDILRCCRSTLYNLRRSGQLKNVKVKGKILFSKDALTEYITKETKEVTND